VLISPAGSAALELSLCCLIFGWGSDENTINFDIGQNTTINELKRKIKDELAPAFEKVVVSMIQIWKVSRVPPIWPSQLPPTCAIFLQLGTPIPEADIEERLEGVSTPTKIQGGAEKLRGPRMLSSYFTVPPSKDVVHLVVEPPASGEYQRIASR
jgi:hypothetical protein